MTTATHSTDIYFTATCRPWTGDARLREHRVCVEPDGTVLVWDEIARAYTRVHALSASAIRRLRRLAKEVDPANCGACGEGYDGRTGEMDAIAGPLCPECSADLR